MIKVLGFPNFRILISKLTQQISVTQIKFCLQWLDESDSLGYHDGDDFFIIIMTEAKIMLITVENW